MEVVMSTKRAGKPDKRKNEICIWPITVDTPKKTLINDQKLRLPFLCSPRSHCVMIFSTLEVNNSNL